MIMELRIKDARTESIEYREVKVYVDGKKIDTIKVNGELHPGTTLESAAISKALQGRSVLDVSFTGEMVNVRTEPE